MKKDKNWLKIELIENILTYLGSSEKRKETLNLVSQLDEPEKVVIPQFVADLLEEYKGKSYRSLYSVFIDVESDNVPYELENWFVIDDNDETFCRAWLDGYSVEKEKLYYVALPYIGYMTNDKDQPFVDYKEDATKSTEQEIKAIDERFWAFREEVEG